MYAGDNADNLVNNHTEGDAKCGPNAWITSGSKLGVGSWTGNARVDPTNWAVVYGILYPYNTGYKIYHCPADLSTVNGEPYNLRSRSVSMSVGMNWVDSSEATPTNGSFVKLTQATDGPRRLHPIMIPPTAVIEVRSSKFSVRRSAFEFST